MHITKNARAAALYSGVLGAFLESSDDAIDQGHDRDILQRCREWLLEHNPLMRQFDWRSQLNASSFPTVHTSDSTLENNPSMRPEIVMDPSTFESEVNQEDYRHFRLPVAHIEDRKGHQHVLTRGDAEI